MCAEARPPDHLPLLRLSARTVNGTPSSMPSRKCPDRSRIDSTHGSGDRGADSVGSGAHGIVREVGVALCHARRRMANDCSDDDQALAADCAHGDVAVAKIVRPHSRNASGLADAAPGLV
jgi:hypothetical protein